MVQRKATGELSDNCVIITNPKHGNRLHNRGYYGIPQSGGGLKLDLIEAYYLLDEGKIKIKSNKKELDLKDLLKDITKIEPTFEIKYIVYRDLRIRGLILKTSNFADFAIYKGNSSGSKGRQIKAWCQAVSERSIAKLPEISELISDTRNSKKDLIFAVVDEEGDLTYYEVLSTNPKGKTSVKPTKFKNKSEAILVEDRVMLWSPDLITELRDNGFYGKIIGTSLQLALTESAYLIKQNIISIRHAKTNKKLTLKQFIKIAKKIQPNFDLRLLVYEELKSRNLIVKTGFKYGTHFRVYRGDPNEDHSELLVHSVKNDYQSNWEEISRAVRLAQGVRKKMLYARVGIEQDPEKIEYINIERIKP